MIERDGFVYIASDTHDAFGSEGYINLSAAHCLLLCSSHGLVSIDAKVTSSTSDLYTAMPMSFAQLDAAPPQYRSCQVHVLVPIMNGALAFISQRSNDSSRSQLLISFVQSKVSPRLTPTLRTFVLLPPPIPRLRPNAALVLIFLPDSPLLVGCGLPRLDEAFDLTSDAGDVSQCRLVGRLTSPLPNEFSVSLRLRSFLTGEAYV
jgi:hypothetical protein